MHIDVPIACEPNNSTANSNTSMCKDYGPDNIIGIDIDMNIKSVTTSKQIAHTYTSRLPLLHLLNHRLPRRTVSTRPFPLLMHPQPPVSKLLRHRTAPTRHELPATVHMVVPHVEAAVIRTHQRNERALDDGAARVLGPDEGSVLVVVEPCLGSNFAVGGAGGGAEDFSVVESHGYRCL